MDNNQYNYNAAPIQQYPAEKSNKSLSAHIALIIAAVMLTVSFFLPIVSL